MGLTYVIGDGADEAFAVLEAPTVVEEGSTGVIGCGSSVEVGNNPVDSVLRLGVGVTDGIVDVLSDETKVDKVDVIKSWMVVDPMLDSPSETVPTYSSQLFPMDSRNARSKWEAILEK